MLYNISPQGRRKVNFFGMDTPMYVVGLICPHFLIGLIYRPAIIHSCAPDFVTLRFCMLKDNKKNPFYWGSFGSFLKS